ncbi:MAG: regulatory protein RecX [Clostridia bacterium]|nr:regulatory protein RecX [Clostridia bacterium]
MQERKKKTPPTNDLDSAKRAAMDGIQRRKYTVYELTQKLIQKGFSEDLAREACLYYEELGYLDDTHYAVCFIKDAIRLKGYGYRRIAEDLYRRGVDRAIVEEVYPPLDPDPIERLGLQLEQLALPQNPYEEQKLYAHFLRRGFSASEVAEALRRKEMHLG